MIVANIDAHLSLEDIIAILQLCYQIGTHREQYLGLHSYMQNTEPLCAIIDYQGKFSGWKQFTRQESAIYPRRRT